MHPLLVLLVLAGTSFGWGIARGSVLCATICAPAFATRAVDRGFTVRQGIAAAIWFNIPRIILLTILGIAVGFLAYSISSSVEENVEVYRDATGVLRRVGYFILGIIVTIMGLRMLIRNLDELEDIKEGLLPDNRCAACADCHEKKTDEDNTTNLTTEGTEEHRGTAVAESPDKNTTSAAPCSDSRKWNPAGSLKELLGELDPGDRKLFFASGGALSIACTAELFAGTLFTGTGLSMLQGYPYAAAAVGGMFMFAFSVGATLPFIVTMSAAVTAANKATTSKGINRVKLFGAAVALIMGILLMLMSLV